MINSANYDDPDLAETYYDYDHNFLMSSVNPGIVASGAGHHLDIGFGSGPASGASHARGSFPLHYYHNSQSMHE